MLFKKKTAEQIGFAGFVVSNQPNSIVSEQYRMIRTNIQFSMVDQQLQTLLVVGPTPNSGKTITALNLAAAFASEGSKVLTVSTDMRKPSIHKILEHPNNIGLTSLLSNRDLSLEESIISSKIDNLYHLLSGPVPPNPAELLNSNRMKEITEEMKTFYELIIFDSPPILAVTDAQILATKVDGTLVVLPQGEVTKKELTETVDRLENVKANVIGVVMNKVRGNKGSYYYYQEDDD